MSLSPPAAVTLRPATPDDCRRVWLWRNDEETRRASFDSSPIPFEIHEPWFRASLRSRDRKIYIIIVEGEPAGVVRLDLDGEQAEVSINLAPGWRYRGVGPVALERLAELAFGALGLGRLLASVKADNQASLSAFDKAGFSRSELGARVTLLRARHEG